MRSTTGASEPGSTEPVGAGTPPTGTGPQQSPTAPRRWRVRLSENLWVAWITGAATIIAALIPVLVTLGGGRSPSATVSTTGTSGVPSASVTPPAPSRDYTRLTYYRHTSPTAR